MMMMVMGLNSLVYKDGFSYCVLCFLSDESVPSCFSYCIRSGVSYEVCRGNVLPTCTCILLYVTSISYKKFVIFELDKGDRLKISNVLALNLSLLSEVCTDMSLTDTGSCSDILYDGSWV